MVRRRPRGFTLLELIVVMAIIATLLTLAMPRYFSSLERGRESVLRHDLAAMRDAIDKFLADRGRYPESLDELAAQRYLRRVPVDPLTDSAATWVLLPPPESAGPGAAQNAANPGAAAVYDIRSGAKGLARNGEAYESW
jgi:general secretion pathway protein G